MTDEVSRPAVAVPVQGAVGRPEPERGPPVSGEFCPTPSACEAFQCHEACKPTPEREEGAAAARNGFLFDACPYTFQACGFDPSKFDRKKLNLWFDGWSRQYKKTLGYLPNTKMPPNA